MNGGKAHGGRAYDSGYSAFQKKGLISPMQQKKDLPKEPQETWTKTGSTKHKGGDVSTYTSSTGQTRHTYLKGGQGSDISEKEAKGAYTASQQKQEAKDSAKEAAQKKKDNTADLAKRNAEKRAAANALKAKKAQKAKGS